MTTEQKGPFFDWGVRASGIAARAVRNSMERSALIAKVRVLRSEGKRDEVEAMKSEFDANRTKWQAILGDAKKFQSDFAAKFQDRTDQNAFVNGIRREAIANRFTVRHEGDIINVASQVMWVVAPWDKDTQGVLQLRMQTGCNITDTHSQSLKRLIRAAEDLLKKLSKDLPSLEDMELGTADFAAQTTSDEMDEINANVGCANRVLARVEGAAGRRQDERRMQQGGGEQPGGGEGHERVEEDPIKKLEQEIKAKDRALQSVIASQEFEKAPALRDEIAVLNAQLEDEKKKLRESGARATAGSAPESGTPVVKLADVMMVDDETGESVKVEDLVTKYEAQVAEQNEAAVTHDAEAASAEAEGDSLMAEKKKSEAGKKYLSAETSRTAATQCLQNATKLTAKIEELKSHATSERARLAKEAKEKVKGAGGQSAEKQKERRKKPAPAAEPVVETAEPPAEEPVDQDLADLETSIAAYLAAGNTPMAEALRGAANVLQAAKTAQK